jgi:hypothetical protein
MKTYYFYFYSQNGAIFNLFKIKPIHQNSVLDYIHFNMEFCQNMGLCQIEQGILSKKSKSIVQHPKKIHIFVQSYIFSLCACGPMRVKVGFVQISTNVDVFPELLLKKMISVDQDTV